MSRYTRQDPQFSHERISRQNHHEGKILLIINLQPGKFSFQEAN